MYSIKTIIFILILIGFSTVQAKLSFPHELTSSSSYKKDYDPETQRLNRLYNKMVINMRNSEESDIAEFYEQLDKLANKVTEDWDIDPHSLNVLEQRRSSLLDNIYMTNQLALFVRTPEKVGYSFHFPGFSCGHILHASNETSGGYWIEPAGNGYFEDINKMYCDNENGGWILVGIFGPNAEFGENVFKRHFNGERLLEANQEIKEKEEAYANLDRFQQYGSNWVIKSVYGKDNDAVYVMPKKGTTCDLSNIGPNTQDQCELVYLWNTKEQIISSNQLESFSSDANWGIIPFYDAPTQVWLTELIEENN